MKLSELKNQYKFYSKNEYGNKRIKNFKKDIKIITKAMKEKDYSANGLSDSNIHTYTIIIDKDLEEALKGTKICLKSAFNERFYKQRAARFLELTGNYIVDKKAIDLLEECRYLLIRGEATEQEISQILPSNHKLDIKG